MLYIAVHSYINTLGRLQSSRLYNALKDQSGELILTSSLLRTQQTMERFIESGTPHLALDLLNEINWGVHEGKSAEPWMIKEYERIIMDWSEGRIDSSPREGESARSWRASYPRHRTPREQKDRQSAPRTFWTSGRSREL